VFCRNIVVSLCEYGKAQGVRYSQYYFLVYAVYLFIYDFSMWVNVRCLMCIIAMGKQLILVCYAQCFVLKTSYSKGVFCV
jgi:hypothetical protein